MSWEKAQIKIAPAAIGTGIKVSLRKGKKSPAAMHVTVRESVGKQLGWSDGDKLEVLIGTGEHHGLLRLRKNNSVGEATVSYREMSKGSWFSVTLGHQPMFVDRNETGQWVQWEKVDDGWFELVLPKWTDETAPRQRPPSSQAQPSKAAPVMTRRVEDVTANLMGDPPPGRREMLEKIGKVRA